MHSARTEGSPPGRLARWLAMIQRLNVRLVLILASVALVALLVSSVALSHILPGYLDDLATRRATTAALGTRLLVEVRVDAFRQADPTLVMTKEFLNTRLLSPEAQKAASLLAQGTVQIYYGDEQGNLFDLAAQASPDPDTDARLRHQGLEPDPSVNVQIRSDPLEVGPDEAVELIFVISNVYTNRATTLQRVNGTLIGAGLAALGVAMFVGPLAATRLTGPLARLRRASSRFAQGDLDERAPEFAIVEVDALGQQFKVMADRLSDSLRMLQADRHRLREFVADVSHELRTPIAALRTFTELQHDGQLEDDQRREFLERSSEQISRLEWMSNNLLDLSRIDSGIFPLDM